MAPSNPSPIPSAPASAPVCVRRAGPSDLDDLVRLEQGAFDGDRMSRAQYRRHLASDSAQILLAGAGPQDCLGSIVLFFRRRSTVARVYSLATRPEARGRGIGAALLRAATAAARRRGCRVLRLEVRTDNAAAIALYERLGYRRFGTWPHYYQDGADAWRYEQVLG